MVTDAVSYFETQHGIELKRVSGDEYAGACPWCGGVDRFRVWRDKGNYWCRPGPGHCGREGFADELSGEKMTADERRRLAIESRLAAVERKQADHERRMSVLEKMHQSKEHIRYFHNLGAHTDAIEYWCNEGMSLQTIDDYMLGYCPRCPTDREGRASYTIPVMIGGKLYNIRHRLIGADNGDKYRPQMAGLPSVLFNADYLYQDSHRLLVTEGEKKSIVTAQLGFENVGLMGKTGFNPAWAVRFEKFPLVYVALDPDATEQAAQIAALFSDRGRVVILPDKLDDMIVKYGATKDDIEAFLAQGKRV